MVRDFFYFYFFFQVQFGYLLSALTQTLANMNNVYIRNFLPFLGLFQFPPVFSYEKIFKGVSQYYVGIAETAFIFPFWPTRGNIMWVPCKILDARSR
jgi:hypothetical protein